MVDRLLPRRITAREARELAAAHFHVEPSRIVGGTELAWGGWMVRFRPPEPYGPGPIFVCGRTGEVHATGSAELERVAHLAAYGPDVPFSPRSPREPAPRSWWRRLRDRW